MKNKIILAVLGIVFIGFIPSAYALSQEHIFYKEADLILGYSDDLKWLGKYGELATSLGFEDFRRFSSDYGDFLTTDLQVRVGYDSLKGSHKAFSLDIHNAWLEYKLGLGSKIIVGHFDPAFGLEPVLDTHSKLLQTLAIEDIGFKKDWGIGYKGLIGDWDYQTALSIGSGMAIYRRDGSFLSSFRIGRGNVNDLAYGFSLLYGKTLMTESMQTFPRPALVSDQAVLKKRIGFDAQKLVGQFLFKGEAAYGKNDRDDVLGYLVEADYTWASAPKLITQVQWQSFYNDLSQRNSDDSIATLGFEYKINSANTLRVALSADTNRFGGNEDKTVVVQWYFWER
jgi:hypothetical protein